MKLQFNFLVGCVAGAILAAAPVGATAITITSSSSVSIDYNGFYSDSQTLIPGLSAEVNLSGFTFSSVTIDGHTATQVKFDYTISNTSTSPVTDSRVSNFAFNTTPNILATSLNTVTGAFTAIQTGATQPNGVGVVEICFTAQSCPGGGSDGVAMGHSGSGTATLNFLGTMSSFTIDNSYVRYQSVACLSGSPCNASASGVPTSPSNDPVPEPSTYALISGGLIGVWYMGRRRLNA